MNDIIKQLNDLSVENTEKTHKLLDTVLMSTVSIFEGTEVRFNQSTATFEFSSNNIRVEVIRDLNSFSVISRAIRNTDVVAECVVSIFGNFEERYTRIHDAETKEKLSKWFSAIGDIDVYALGQKEETNVASDGTAVEEVVSPE
jgi:hypothetical protein